MVDTPFPRDLAARIEAAARRAMQEGAERIAATARDSIGHEQPDWPELAASTIREKTRAGHVGRISPTDPLLATGELRGSITTTDTPDGGIAVVSTSPLAVIHELGTIHIPPRPFLGPAAEAHREEIGKAVADAVAEAIRNALGRR